MSKYSRTEIFEKMPVKQAVLMQIIPSVASQMIALIYNLADTYFVGMLNQPRQTAAITIVCPLFVMLTAISNLFGVGGASSIASMLGTKQPHKAKQVASVAFWFGLGSAILFSLIFALSARPLLNICGAKSDTYELAFKYALWTIVFGGPFTIMNTLLANLVRAEGSAAQASIGVSLGGVINIILDPFFVLPRFLGMGAIGAGAATAISNAAATLYFLIYILVKRGNTVLSIAPRKLVYTGKYIKSILSVGLPSALQLMLTVVSLAAISNFIAKYCTEAIAAFGIVKKLDQLPLYFSIGVANGMLPLLAYNHASGDSERRKSSFRFGAAISVGFSLLCLIVYEIFAPQLSALFIDDAVTVGYSSVFLRCMVTAMPMMALCYPLIIQFQAMKRIKESLICSVLRKGVIDIPLLFIMDAIFPLFGCVLVQPVVDTMSLIVALIFARRINRKD